MITDKENMFATATAATSSAQCGDIIDLGTSGIGDGAGLKAFVDIATTFAGTAASYVQFGLQASDYVGFGTSVVTLSESGTIGLSTLAAGAQVWKTPVPFCSKRYLRLYFTSSVVMTDGAVDAGLVLENQTNLTF